METTYTVTFTNEWGDGPCQADDLTFEEFKELAKELKEKGGRIIEALKYRDGEFAGRPAIPR